MYNCNLFYDPIYANYLIEYRGNFKDQIDKVPYACGAILNDTIGVISVEPKNLDKLLKDVPSIIFLDLRSIYVLEDISPVSVDNINPIKVNPYLNLTGNGVVVGIVDTGIDYLNEEFIREDGTSRIIAIWDQTIENKNNVNNENLYIGTQYSNEQINAAIKAYKNNQDPYAIVPSKDEIGHGTQVAGIIGARGYNQQFQGIANDCTFVVVKLLQSNNFQKMLLNNGIPIIPVYNASEILAGLEYLKRTFKFLNKPLVIYLGLGTTEGSHDGGNLISRYISDLGNLRGVCLVTGTGNEGDSQGHASGYIRTVGDEKSIELKIPRQINHFSFSIWIKKPDRASLNVISPTGEESKIIISKINKLESHYFVFMDTEMSVRYYSPEHFTGNEVILITFNNIKQGIWTFKLIGDYITTGRYDSWLPPKITLPENTIFTQSDPYNTLTVPSTAVNTISSAYYGENNSLIATSGKGFNTNNLINPDIATIGTNILTTTINGKVTTMSGSSAANSIVAGTCALLLQWGIVNGNDTTMYSQKIRSYLIYGAYRNPIYEFPNREIGYGALDLLGTFNVISRGYRNESSNLRLLSDTAKKFIEYALDELFVRIPINNEEDFNYEKL